MSPNRTSLAESHQASGAQFRARGDYEIPVSFSRPEAEYQAVKQVAGIMDHCHAPRFKLEGVQRVEAIDRIASINVAGMHANRSRNAYICNEEGGVLDEVTIIKTDQYVLVQGTCTDREAFHSYIQEQLSEFEVEFVESTTAQGCIEVRGPMARTMMEAVLLDGTLPTERGASDICAIGQARCLVTRRRFAGMDSYLIHTGAFFLQALWDRLTMTGRNMGATPAGWHAQEMLRIEAGLPGFGAEIDTDTTPIELGTTGRVDFSKNEFVGREAMMHQSCAEFSRRLVRLRFEAIHPLEPGMWLEFDSMPVGCITSAVTLPDQRATAALGFVDILRSQPGTALQARAETHVISGKVVESQFAETAVA